MERGERWTRVDYEACPRRLLRAATWWKPAVCEVEAPSGGVIVKDARACPRATRAVGRWCLARERRALARVAGVAGVPRIAGVIDDDALVVEAVAAEPMRAGHTPGGIRSIADRLLALIGEVHRRGVYHLDLRHKQNVLVDVRGMVTLVDFGAAVTLPRWICPVVGPLLAGVDRRAALKFVARWAPETLTAREARSVLRGDRLRRAWVFSRHRPPAGEMESVAARLAESKEPKDPWEHGA